MASDNIVVSKGKVTAVADAIRDKAGTTDTLTLDQMPTAIAEIQTGGGSGEDFYIDDASFLFYNGARLNALTVLLGKLKNVTDMMDMFYGCSGLTSLDLSSFDTSNVTNMYGMFLNCNKLTSLDLSSFDTSNVTNMYGMFSGCSKLTSLDLSSFNTSNVTNMNGMFYNCKVLTSLDLSSFNTSNVTDMSYIFYNCKVLTSLDLSSFNTSKATNMSYMFSGCSKLTSLDLSSFNTSKVTNMNSMFNNCNSLEEIIGFSASYTGTVSVSFPIGASVPLRGKLKRLTFRTDLPSGSLAFRNHINIKYCSFERNGMVELFNTLPDLTSISTSKNLTITGNPCITGTLSDGTACETLTDDDRAIATAKGWTLVE